MPYALSIGVDLPSFWGLTPHSLLLIAKGYDVAFKRQIERDNAVAYIQGQYIVEAIAMAVGGKHNYPDKPYDLNLDGRKEEREKDAQLKLFASQLTNSMSNFNLSKENKG